MIYLVCSKKIIVSDLVVEDKVEGEIQEAALGVVVFLF